jgi:exonuclease III
MRIVSWNCNGALRKKLDILSALDSDICIIQECEDPARCSDVSYRKWAQNHLWVGSNKNRGLGVFAKPDVSLEPVSLDPGPLELFLPCIVANRISLLATWTRQANSPTFRYIGQLWKYLQQHQHFLTQPESILIGDLNSNTCWDVWDRWWNHSDVVRQLQEIGLRSLYHHERSEDQGKENTPTFFMYRRSDKPYHIDYAFLSEILLEGASLEVGTPTHWIEHSDHMPIIVHIADNAEPKENCC